MSAMLVTESELTCPKCGHRSRETMSTDACIYFYDCHGCGTLLKPEDLGIAACSARMDPSPARRSKRTHHAVRGEFRHKAGCPPAI